MRAAWKAGGEAGLPHERPRLSGPAIPEEEGRGKLIL